MTYNIDYSQYENKYIFNYSQYKKSINKNNNFTFTIIFLLIILLLGLCVFLKPKDNKLNKFYFVEVDNFQTYDSALKLSQTVKEKTGAGYIYFDNIYHVIASFYSKEKDAEKVCENLKNEYENVQVFCISYPQFVKQKNLSLKQNCSVENLINVCRKITLQLEQLSIDFETGKTPFKEAKILLANYYESFFSTFNEFNAQFNTNSKYNLSKSYAHEIDNSIRKLKESEEQNFSSLLRFELTSIAISIAQFSSSF